MKKIQTVDSTTSNGAGSKGKFIKTFRINNSENKNRVSRAKNIEVDNPTHNEAGSKGLFTLNIPKKD